MCINVVLMSGLLVVSLWFVLVVLKEIEMLGVKLMLFCLLFVVKWLLKWVVLICFIFRLWLIFMFVWYRRFCWNKWFWMKLVYCLCWIMFGVICCSVFWILVEKFLIYIVLIELLLRYCSWLLFVCFMNLWK